MPHDKGIDFGSLKGSKSRTKAQKGKSIESDSAFQAEMADVLDKIPTQMQKYIDQRFMQTNHPFCFTGYRSI